VFAEYCYPAEKHCLIKAPYKEALVRS